MHVHGVFYSQQNSMDLASIVVESGIQQPEYHLRNESTSHDLLRECGKCGTRLIKRNLPDGIGKKK